MQPAHRQQAILRRLGHEGEVSYGALATDYAVSEMTIRRDVEALEASGQARRVRGGAISVVSRAYEPPFAMRRITAGAAKAAIGRAAAALVDEGDTIVLDVGTTTLELARALRGRRGLTVVTASLQIAVELGNELDMRVLVSGGRVRAGELSLTGGMAEDAFASVNCDIAFIGVAGVNSTPGLTDYNPEDARVKRAAIRAARRTVVLADSGKLGRVTFSTITTLSEVDLIVTDAQSAHPVVQEAAAAGVQMLHADRPNPPATDTRPPSDHGGSAPAAHLVADGS